MKGWFLFQRFAVVSFLLLTSTAAGLPQASAQQLPPGQNPQSPLGSEFTYQGQLKNTSGPVSGLCNFTFSLWNADIGGTQVGSTLSANGVNLVDGLFAVQLDFGESAFNGEKRWVEIKVMCSGDAGYTKLDPRQLLTASPYAAYSLHAPWGGLLGLPPGFADNIDNDTTYTNGSGLSLSNNQFSVNFGSNGAAVTAARSDHNHLGQTWTGGSSGLTITGNFSSGESAPLILTNSNLGGDGIRVVQAGDSGLSIGQANFGVVVDQATSDGLYVVNSGINGVRVVTTGSNGVSVTDAAANGVRVGQADQDGVHVVHAGTPNLASSSASSNGLEVEGTQGYGVYIGQADLSALYVNAAASDGLFVNSAGDDGIQINSATDDAMYIFSAGGDGLYVLNTTDDGIDVGGTDLAGYFAGNIQVTGNCTGCLLATFGINTGDRPLQPGDIVSVRSVRTSEVDGIPVIWEVAAGEEGLAAVGVVSGRAETVTREERRPDERGLRLVPRVGISQPGEYVTIVIYGPVQVRAAATGESIQPGVRLAAGADGLARPLKTVQVQGVQLAENAATIGITLSAPDAEGLVWVLVTPH